MLFNVLTTVSEERKQEKKKERKKERKKGLLSAQPTWDQQSWYQYFYFLDTICWLLEQATTNLPSHQLWETIFRVPYHKNEQNFSIEPFLSFLVFLNASNWRQDSSSSLLLRVPRLKQQGQLEVAQKITSGVRWWHWASLPHTPGKREWSLGGNEIKARNSTWSPKESFSLFKYIPYSMCLMNTN